MFKRLTKTVFMVSNTQEMSSWLLVAGCAVNAEPFLFYYVYLWLLILCFRHTPATPPAPYSLAAASSLHPFPSQFGHKMAGERL